MPIHDAHTINFGYFSLGRMARFLVFDSHCDVTIFIGKVTLSFLDFIVNPLIDRESCFTESAKNEPRVEDHVREDDLTAAEPGATLNTAENDASCRLHKTSDVLDCRLVSFFITRRGLETEA